MVGMGGRQQQASSRQVAGSQKVGRWAGVEGVSRRTEYGQNADRYVASRLQIGLKCNLKVLL